MGFCCFWIFQIHNRPSKQTSFQMQIMERRLSFLPPYVAPEFSKGKGACSPPWCMQHMIILGLKTEHYFVRSVRPCCQCSGVCLQQRAGNGFFSWITDNSKIHIWGYFESQYWQLKVKIFSEGGRIQASCPWTSSAKTQFGNCSAWFCGNG